MDRSAGSRSVGPLLVPWVSNARLELDGESHVLGGIERMRSTTVAEAPDGCEFTMVGRDMTVRGQVSALRKDLVGWIYADTVGEHEHNTVNCSISTMVLTVERPGRPTETLTCPGGAVYELGMRETDHGVPIQPFPNP